MSFSLTQKNIARIIGIQFALLFAITVITAFIVNRNTGLAILLGGLSCGLPTVLFAWSLFCVRHAPGIFLICFMLGEVIRLLLGAMLFVLVIMWFPVNILPVLIGFVGAIISFWIASLWFVFKQKKVELS